MKVLVDEYWGLQITLLQCKYPLEILSNSASMLWKHQKALRDFKSQYLRTSPFSKPNAIMNFNPIEDLSRKFSHFFPVYSRRVFQDFIRSRIVDKKNLILSGMFGFFLLSRSALLSHDREGEEKVFLEKGSKENNNKFLNASLCGNAMSSTIFFPFQQCEEGKFHHDVHNKFCSLSTSFRGFCSFFSLSLCFMSKAIRSCFASLDVGGGSSHCVYFSTLFDLLLKGPETVKRARVK